MAESDDTDPKNAKTVADAAARWRVALDGETASEADWLAFEQWLSADPKHHGVYAAMEDASIDAELALAQRSSAPTPTANAQKVVPFSRRLLTRPAVWAAGLAALAASTLFFVVRTPSEPLEYAFAAPATADERVVLPDGSSVHLNRNASIHVTFGDTRRIVLQRGEASFDVEHDESRPFEVAAGDTLVRDVGTMFNIARNRTSTVVTVSEGEVEIAGPQFDSVRVAAGHRARIVPGSPVAVAATSGDAFAWRQGRLVYADAPLAEVIEDLDRYSTTPIELAADAADQRFSGILILDAPQDMLARLEGFLPIRSVQGDDRIVVESRP